jgi:hypothetical protein
MHGARAALRHTAPIFRSGKTEMFADDPKQWSGRIDVEIDAFAVNGETEHRSSPNFFVLGR